jgi:hypothetical protein
MKVVILILTLFLISCNAGDPKTDTDTVPDKDSALNDADTETVDDLSDGVLTESDDISDADSATECLPPLIDAPFPYYDNDGNITFCRPDCNEATEKDPQCMSNLWKEQNQALCTQMPQYDCCGYPCVMESLKPLTKEELYKLVPEMEDLVPMHQCDLYLSRWSNDGTMGVVKSWNMSDGKIGFYLSPAKPLIKDWPVKLKYVSYDIETKQYNFIIPARGQEQAYYKGKRIGLTADKRSLDLNNTNIFMAYISDDGKMELIYNKKLKQLPYEPALNDKWAFANISEPGSKKMSYAKVGEWKWTSLGEGLGWFPSLVGDKLSFTDDDVNGWICDLSKNPQKLSDCLKFNKEGEQTEYLYFDKEDENRFAYYSTFERKIVLAEKEDDSYKRTDIITEFTEASSKNAFSLLPRMFRGNILLYEEVTTDGNEYGGLLCYYRIDKKKKYCMKKMDNDETYSDGTTRFPYGYAEFEGKWLLYQKRSSTPLILRDMECYCKEEGVCPFEE